MKFFTIPVWDEHTDIEHFATSWVASKDRERNEVLIENLKSESDVISFKANLVVPNGEVYYISALRHLKDLSGAEIYYKEWIPVLPITSESHEGEIVGDNVDIDKPAILDLKIDDLNGLEITTSPYRGVSNHKETIMVFYSDQKEIYVKRQTTDDLTKIKINPSEFDFTIYPEIDLFIMYRGEFDNVSPKLRDSFSYVNSLYEIVGNKSDINPNLTVKFTIKPLTQKGITVTRAGLYDLDGKLVVIPNIDGYDVVIPLGDNYNSYLVKDTTYRLTLTITYIDKDGKTVTVDKSDYLSTTDDENNSYFDEDVEYKENLRLSHRDISFSVTETGHIEHTLTNYIVYIDKYGRVKMSRVMDASLQPFDTGIDTGIDLITDAFAVRLIDLESLAICFTKNGKVRVAILNYDRYDTTLTLREIIDTDVPESVVITNSPIVMDDKIILPFIEDNKAFLTEVNTRTGSISKSGIGSFYGLDSASEMSCSMINNSDMLMVVKDSQHAFIYSFIYREIKSENNVPTEFRGLTLGNHRLLNGNVLFTKYNSTDKKFNIMIFDLKTPGFKVLENSLQYTDTFKVSFNYRNSTVDFLGVNEDGTADLIRFD